MILANSVFFIGHLVFKILKYIFIQIILKLKTDVSNFLYLPCAIFKLKLDFYFTS